jgi:hypothetical protein
MFKYNMEHLFSYNVTLEMPPEVIGPVPEGLRANVYLTGGEVDGPKLKGKVRPVGADWLTVRPDGITYLDIRATIESHDGALIYVTYNGVLDLGPDGYQTFMNGELPASGTPIRINPWCHTAHPDYEWMNRCLCVGVGEAYLERGEVAYDVYAVR